MDYIEDSVDVCMYVCMYVRVSGSIPTVGAELLVSIFISK